METCRDLVSKPALEHKTRSLVIFEIGLHRVMPGREPSQQDFRRGTASDIPRAECVDIGECEPLRVSDCSVRDGTFERHDGK